MLSLCAPVETPLHRLPAGLKLAALALVTPALFALQGPGALALALAAVAGLYALFAPALLRPALRLMRPLGWFVAVILTWHLWLGEPGQGAAISLRMLAAVALANLVTMTTPLEAMIEVLMRLLAPLRRLGVNPAPLDLGIALVIRFVPVLLEKARALTLAWRARSPRRPGWQMILPLSLMALDDAEHVAEALRARGGVAARD